MKYAHFNNKSFTNSIEICLILITKFAKLYNFDEISYKFAKICNDFGEISFACLTKYAFFFGIGKIMTDNQVKYTILGE